MDVRKSISAVFSALRLAGSVVWQATIASFEHDASTMGAAIAFYTTFSIAPILIIAIGIFRLLVGSEAIRPELLTQMRVLSGDSGAAAVQALLVGATDVGTGRFVAIIGITTLLVGASSVFVELQNSLDRIWGLPRRSRLRSVWVFVRTRFLSLGLVFGVGFLLMVSLLVSTLVAAMDLWVATYLGKWEATLFIADMIFSVALTTMLFAIVYKYIPQIRMEWQDVWVGAAVAAALFNVGKIGIGYLVGRSALPTVYGAAGSLLVLLLWAYYSAQIFLFGAEMTRAYSFVAGTRKGQKP